MYGEPAAIRRVADRLEARAEELRGCAEELRARSDTVEWVSSAATAMRVRTAQECLALREVAGRYDEAGAAVRRHAARVEELLARIAEIQRRVSALLAEAADRLQRAAAAVVDGVSDLLGVDDDRRLLETPWPPPGHRDWLDVPARLGLAC